MPPMAAINEAYDDASPSAIIDVLNGSTEEYRRGIRALGRDSASKPHHGVEISSFRE